MNTPETSPLGRITRTVGFIGAGNMASALVRGLIGAGLPPGQVAVTDLDADKASVLAAETGVSVLGDAAHVASSTDVVVLAVKPGSLEPLLAGLSDHRDGRLWLSIAAGLSTNKVQAALGGTPAVVRAMPNTPALVRAGATAICAGAHASASDLDLSEQLLGAIGLVVRVTESQMDAVTGLSGSGPAFIMLVIEALADGGVRAGLPRDVAQRLAAQTVLGSASLAIETGRHPAELKDSVASPGGTTIAGVEELELRGLRGALMAAVGRAAARARELGS